MIKEGADVLNNRKNVRSNIGTFDVDAVVRSR